MTSYQLWGVVFPQEKRWLGIIISVSLLLHISVFFLFSIERLPDTRAIERPPSVVFISPQTGSGRLDGSDPMQWINWRDPAVIALPQAPIPEPVPMESERQVEYKTRSLPALPEWNPLKVNDLSVEEGLKSMVQTKMENTSAEAMPLNVEAPPKLSGSVVVLKGALAGRKIERKIEMPRPQTKVSLRATEYYLRVLAGGGVVQVKVDQTCGDNAIDMEGLNILKRWRFAAQPEGEQDVWGKVIVFWDFQEENPDKMEIVF